jgi:hypothetical protein
MTNKEIIQISKSKPKKSQSCVPLSKENVAWKQRKYNTQKTSKQSLRRKSYLFHDRSPTPSSTLSYTTELHCLGTWWTLAIAKSRRLHWKVSRGRLGISSQIHSPWMGDTVDSDILYRVVDLSYQPASPMPESTLSLQPFTINWLLNSRPPVPHLYWKHIRCSVYIPVHTRR